MIQTFTPPPPSTNSVTINQIGSGFGIGPSFGWPPDTVTASANLQVTVTGTWTSDSNSDNTAPPGVWLSESSTASATCTNAGVMQAGSADDGWGDPVAQSGSQMGTSAPAFGQQYVKQPGGSFTASLTLSASASGTQGMYQGSGGASASVGPITIAIHAQPYNFHRVPGQSVLGNDGTIGWTYGYSSTDGNTNDLTSCYWHEYLTYQGPVGTLAQPNKYYPPDPPFDYPSTGANGYFSNPDVFPGPSTKGNLMAQQPASAEEYDITKVPNLVAASLYAYGTYTVTQVFQFDDTATGETNVQVPGPGGGPFSIVRTVKYLDATHYQYSVTKDSITNTLLLPD